MYAEALTQKELEALLPPLKPIQYYKSSIGKQFHSARAASERGFEYGGHSSLKRLGGKTGKKELSVVSVPIGKPKPTESSNPEGEYFPSPDSSSMLRTADRGHTGRSLPASDSKMQILKNRYSRGKPLMIRVRNHTEVQSHNISDFSTQPLDSPRKKKVTIEQQLTQLFSPKANHSTLSSAPRIREEAADPGVSHLELTK